MLRDAKSDTFKDIYIVCGRTDLRLGIDSLAAIIENRYQLPILEVNTLFLFCGTKASKIKGLLWEGDGFLIFTKRVDRGHFSWPRDSNEAKKLNYTQFTWLMQGFSIEPRIKESHPTYTA